MSKVGPMIVRIMLICLAVSDSVFAQCPMCKAALTNSVEGQRMVSGFNCGILFLLSVPFVLIGVIGYLIFSRNRQAARRFA